jgi:aminopeptidase N
MGTPALAAMTVRTWLTGGAIAVAAVAAWGLRVASAHAAAEAECGCLAHRLERGEMHAWRAVPGEGKGGTFDAANGRDHRNFPPDPQVEYRAMRLELDFPDLASGRFSGVQRLQVAPIGVPVQSLRLDAEGLRIDAVEVDGAPAEFAHDGSVLVIRFSQPLVGSLSAPGARAAASEVVVRYAGERPIDGLTFSAATPEVPGAAPARGAEVHTQGQTETNRYWFPIHDFPNVRVPTELVITVPKGLQASANGALVSHEVRGDRETWHWRQEKPHVPYLVSLVIGDFERVELPNPLSAVPMAVWAPKGRGADALATYANTDRMMKVFERAFGQPYPWARYDQLIVRNFGAGGMENTSATTMMPTAVHDQIARAEQDLDGLISHELCHQWTGDLVTCRSWEHIWLNEGWATYGTALWMEERDGADGYWDSVLGNARVARGDVPGAPEAMCSPVYERAGQTFSRPANPYPKGASILHMLRRMLGDEVFFRGVHAYMARHALGLAETHDFRRAMEEASGLGLEWFFDQWCFRPGSPVVKAALSYDAATRALTVRAEQAQPIDARTPAMRIRIPVWVRTPGGDRVVPFEMRDRTATVSAVLDGPPVAAWVDPWLEALKVIEVEQPEAWTLAAVGAAPTHAARRQALAQAAKAGTPTALGALERVAGDASARHTLRIDAIEALAAVGSPESKRAVLALAKGPIDDPRVRAASVRALAKCDGSDAVPVLRSVIAAGGGAPRERSYAVRAAAVEALADLGAKDALPDVRPLVAEPSHGESVSQAALRFVAKFGDASDLPAAQARCALGIADRARPTAVDAVAELAKRADGDARTGAEAFLVRMVEDPEERTAMSAGAALAQLKCRAALDRLRAMAERDRDPARRRRAQAWVKEIEGT